MMKAWRLALLVVLPLVGQASAQNVRQAPGGIQYVVFLHAGPNLSNPKIKQVAGALFEKGYLVRAPDNEQDTVGGAGVDYFDESAKTAADEISTLMNTTLKRLELKTGADQELRSRFQRVKNPPTYIGVWLFGKGAARP